MIRLFIVMAVVFFAACGTVQHGVKVEDTSAFSSGTKVLVGPVSNKTGESFDIDIEAMLRDAMETQLAQEQLLATQDTPGAVKTNINIIEYRKGDAFKRWLWPGYGSTVLVIEALLLDSEGNVDATAQANRSVDFGGGYTAGAWKKIFANVAEDLVSDLKQRITGTNAGSR